MSQAPIDLLICDDDHEFRNTLVRRFQRRGYRVLEASSGEQALDLADRRHFGVAVVDMVMPGMSGLELLAKLRESNPDCEAIMLTGQATVETAVAAMKTGAFDYLSKPFPLAELEVIITKAADRHSLGKENQQLKAALELVQPRFKMIGQSSAMQEVFRIIERAGPTQNAILIQGESGTGKELVARALHQASPRKDNPLVVFNCAALPESLMESELFGHEKGAFTGAVSTKLGLFEVADGGTIMIDEIGEMPGSLQSKLLRVLEDGSLRRVGSHKERHVDVRVLAATNRNMADEVEAGRFREDLYYRINVMSLEIPPLRERSGDVSLLVDHFLGADWNMQADARAVMARYNWPGNVRQLINAIDRAKIMADDHVICLSDLPKEVSGLAPTTPKSHHRPVSGDNLADIERAHITQVLQREGGNKARAARALGINRRSLYRLIEKYDIRSSEVAASFNGR